MNVLLFPWQILSHSLRAGLDLSSGAPQILIVGVDGLTIDWKVEGYRLEV